MTASSHHEYSFDDYVALERDSPVKHEFLSGEIYAMAGGTPEHAALAAAIPGALSEKLRGGKCRVFSSDLNVRVLATGLATYPDVTVVCGTAERDSRSENTVTNPKIVVEVTSKSTEKYDRGEKLWHYQQAPSVDSVVIVSHRERLIEVWTRTGTEWVRTEASSGGRADIPSIGCTLDVDLIYAAAEEPRT